MSLTRPRAHQLQDIDYKQTARAVTVANVTLSGGAPATVDGVSLAKNNRVLVTAQTTGSENGIYFVTTVGAGSNGTWSRTSDSDATGDIKAGTIIMITEGTTYADTQWKLTTDDPITVGSTTMTFVRAGNAAYGTFAVSGQDSIVADTIGDTLTLVAGTNLALTTNDSTDTLTVTPSLTPAVTSLSTTGNVSVNGGGINSTTGMTIHTTTSNTDILFKGNDGGNDITALTLDMSSAGRADFNNGVTTPSYFWQKTDNAVTLYAGANFEIQLHHVHNTGFKLTNTGGGEPTLQFVDANESISSDGTNLKLTSGGSVITVPNSAGNLVVDAATQTLTNKGIDLTDNTVTGTLAEFNTAVSDATLVSTTGSETLTNKTLTNPTINAFTGTGNASIAGDLVITSDGQTTGGACLQIDNTNTSNTFPKAIEAFHANLATGSSHQIALGKDGSTNDTGMISFNYQGDASSSNSIQLGLWGSGSTLAVTGGGNVGIGTTSPDATLEIENTTTDDSLLITTTEDSSTAGPVLTLKRNSASPANGDYLGQLKFKGENDADQEINYAKITAKILDNTDGTEDGTLEFAIIKNGSQNIAARFRSDSLQLINDTQLVVRNITYPLADGSSGQAVVTDGSGQLSFTTISSGSAANQFPNCTVSPLPGSEGDFDLAKQYDQSGSVESPFESITTDAFGVSLGEIYTMMDPVGTTTTTDLGAFS